MSTPSWHRCSFDIAPVAKSAREDTVLRGANALTDVPKEAADGFGPIKAVLGAIPAVYANREVRS